MPREVNSGGCLAGRLRVLTPFRAFCAFKNEKHKNCEVNNAETGEGKDQKHMGLINALHCSLRVVVVASHSLHDSSLSFISLNKFPLHFSKKMHQKSCFHRLTLL